MNSADIFPFLAASIHVLSNVFSSSLMGNMAGVGILLGVARSSSAGSKRSGRNDRMVRARR